LGDKIAINWIAIILAVLFILALYILMILALLFGLEVFVYEDFETPEEAMDFIVSNKNRIVFSS
tara:strand:- start:2416 stop:2607 length:192 start_codon:yes stop_codon:yes gene_type:complete